jgi:hypothetical protein
MWALSIEAAELDPKVVMLTIKTKSRDKHLFMVLFPPVKISGNIKSLASYYTSETLDTTIFSDYKYRDKC